MLTATNKRKVVVVIKASSILRRLIRGDIKRRTLLCFLIPCIVAVFLITLGLAVHSYPGTFDWRYMVISKLSSPKDNPDGYVYFASGLVLTSILMIPLPGYFDKMADPNSPTLNKFGAVFLAIGILGLFLVGMITHNPQHSSTLFYKIHEIFTTLAFIGLSVGVLCHWFAMMNHRLRGNWLRGILFLLTAAPLLGAGFSQLYLYFVPNNLHWVGLHWKRLGVPVVLSFAFWEWLTTFSLFVYFTIVAYSQAE